ncbi:hypothetical protein KMT30_35700, partial [Streptomyces sp. IBSBF 2953]|nr:hypothetical protein [Streptomyces hayashii]
MARLIGWQIPTLVVEDDPHRSLWSTGREKFGGNMVGERQTFLEDMEQPKGLSPLDLAVVRRQFDREAETTVVRPHRRTCRFLPTNRCLLSGRERTVGRGRRSTHTGAREGHGAGAVIVATLRFGMRRCRGRGGGRSL